MDVRGLRTAGAVALLLTGSAGCAAPTEDNEEPPEPEETVPLDLSIERVDISHGALRLTATMVDGAADVSVTLGDACDRREVGGGVSTLSTVVWTLGEAELADALACDLVFRTRVRAGTKHVIKEATVSLAPEVDDSPGNPEDSPLSGVSSASPDGVSVTFLGAGPESRLLAVDSLVESEPADEDEDQNALRRFAVPPRDFARAVLLRWPLRMDGASFDASVQVGDTLLTTEDVEGEDDVDVEDVN